MIHEQCLPVQMATPPHDITSVVHDTPEFRVEVEPPQYYRALQCKWQVLHNGSGVMWTRRQRQYMGTGSSGLLQCYTQISMKDKGGNGIYGLQCYTEILMKDKAGI